MSFWDFIPKLLPTVIAAGATVYGAKMASDAQKDARKTANVAQTKATDAQLEGIRAAEQNTQQLQSAASPGLMRIQSVIGRGEALTPEQILALNDARRTTLDTLQGGSLRGSARATVASVNDVENRMRTNMVAQNRNQADSAASSLSGQYFNAGNNISNLNRDAGNTVSQGLINTGQTDVNTGMNQGLIKGQAIGDIGAVIADAMKKKDQERRDSSYATVNGGGYDDRTGINWNSGRIGAA